MEIYVTQIVHTTKQQKMTQTYALINNAYWTKTVQFSKLSSEMRSLGHSRELEQTGFMKHTSLPT